MSQQNSNDSGSQPDDPGTGAPGGRQFVSIPDLTSNTRLSDTILQFLNVLPASGEAKVWVASLAELIGSLFVDVDLVVVRLNVHCRLTTPRANTVAYTTEDPIELLAQALTEGAPSPVTSPQNIVAPEYEPARYRTAAAFTYSYCGDDLGTIALLRLTEPLLGPEMPAFGVEVSEATREAMRELKPFLQFALTDLVARYSCAKPLSRVFHEIVNAIADETHLTSRELEVLTLHMFGRKYDEISHRLHISIDTVKKHVKKVHRKTGTRSATELFARYFAPLVGRDGHAGGE